MMDLISSQCYSCKFDKNQLRQEWVKKNINLVIFNLNLFRLLETRRVEFIFNMSYYHVYLIYKYLSYVIILDMNWIMDEKIKVNWIKNMIYVYIRLLKLSYLFIVIKLIVFNETMFLFVYNIIYILNT